jgi:hypothetical protein
MQIIRELLGLAFLARPLILMALMVLVFAISIGLALRFAKRTGRNKWVWGAIGFLLVYLPVFWDHIPILVMHEYYCEKEAGFWVYKTLNQWKVENSGVILTPEGRSTNTQKEEGGYKEIHQLNHRFNWVINLQGVSSILQVSKREETLVDTKNNDVLARFMDFSRGNQRSTGTTKFWLVNSDCNGGEIYRVRMGKLIDEIYAEAKGDRK